MIISLAFFSGAVIASYFFVILILAGFAMKEFEPYVFVSAKRFSSGECYFYKSRLVTGGTHDESKRGLVGEAASKSSLRRLRRYVENSVAVYKSMVTLTYPAVFPSATESKQHLNAFLQSLYRMEKCVSVLWVMEYQKRGAVHYHLLCDTDFISYQKIAALWFSATKGTSDIAAGTQIKKLDDNKIGIASYLSKYLSKSYQKNNENGLQGGRYWGVRGERDMKPMEASTVVVDGSTASQMLEKAVKENDGYEFDGGVWWRCLQYDMFWHLFNSMGGFIVPKHDLESPYDQHSEI